MIRMRKLKYTASIVTNHNGELNHVACEKHMRYVVIPSILMCFHVDFSENNELIMPLLSD